MTIVVMDGPTASALAQILPLLLLTLILELRRTALHRKVSRIALAAFFGLFGVIETVLVLSIDGELYPFQWGDLLSAITIFGLLGAILAISLMEPRQF
jgi:NhaP-type Na+/H+ or K+/H+ antiporter